MLRHEQIEMGCWISVPKEGFVKVNGMTKTKIAYHDKYGRFRWVRKEQVVLVPVTEEILENNGFAKGNIPGIDDEPCWTLTETKNMCEQWFVSLWWFDGVKHKDSGVWMVDVKGPYITIHRTVRFLHELQIMMKSGLVDKKIEL